MPSGTAQFDESKRPLPIEVSAIFDDPEARNNLVGLYDLLLKIDRRINPHDYELRGATSHD